MLMHLLTDNDDDNDDDDQFVVPKMCNTQASLRRGLNMLANVIFFTGFPVKQKYFSSHRETDAVCIHVNRVFELVLVRLAHPRSFYNYNYYVFSIC